MKKRQRLAYKQVLQSRVGKLIYFLIAAIYSWFEQGKWLFYD